VAQNTPGPHRYDARFAQRADDLLPASPAARPMRRRSRKCPVGEQCQGTGSSYPEHDVPDQQRVLALDEVVDLEHLGRARVDPGIVQDRH
jgi:hypothetical protein